MGNQGGAQRAQKIAAIAAAGVVLLGGATITSLAAWTDQEYVVGGFDGEPGIGTSVFEVVQRTAGQADFANYEDEADPNVIDFSVDALLLSPGDTVYGYVELTTTADSTVGGVLVLNGATDDGSDLWDALTYGARIVPTTGACDPTGYGASVTGITPDGTPLSTGGTNSFQLEAAGADIEIVCFAVTMDDDASDELQGETVSPVWSFTATSDEP